MTEAVRHSLAFLAGLALLGALFVFLDLPFQTLADQRPDPVFLGALALVSVLYLVTGAWKWQLISKAWYGTAPSFGFALRGTALAVFAAQFLPLPIATALQRTAALKLAEGKTAVQGLAHATYDILFDFAFVGILLLCSLAQLTWGFGIEVWIGGALGGFLILCAALILLPKLIEGLSRCLAPFAWGAKATATLRAWQSNGLLHPGFMVGMAGLGAFRFVLVTLRLWLCALAFDLPIGGDALFFASPLAALPSLVPLTPANLGVAETVWTYLLGFWHIPAAAALLFATDLRFVLLAVHAILGTTLFFLFRKRQHD